MFITAPGVRYASLWSRIDARGIDMVTYIVLYVIVSTLVEGFSSSDDGVPFGLSRLTAVLLWLAGSLDWIEFEARTGATLGKRSLHLRIVSTDVDPIGTGQAIGRYLLLVVDCFLFGLVGLVTGRVSDRRKRVGDRVARTIVVRADRELLPPFPHHFAPVSGRA